MSQKSAGLTSSCVAALVLATAPAASAQERMPFQDAAQPLEARVADLLSRLTLEEEISLLHGDSKFSTAALARFNVERRWMSDGPQGVREEIGPDTWNPAGWTNDFATALPASVGLAASFDPELARAYGNVIGEEALARGKHIMLGPGVNIMRTPLNGRNSEYFGEDPYLASRIAVGYIEGVQSHGVASCVKHFAANNQETHRNTIDVEMDDRTLHEIYLPAFKAAVTEAHAWCVMSAYNRFRGQYCSENDLLLNQILKKDWGFQGLVMSDWAGTHSTVAAALNGLDLEMGTEAAYDKFHLANALHEAVDKGEVPKERVDEMARRNLRVMFATGMFDPPPAEKANAKMMTPEHTALARKIGESAIVLLKNERQTLPLDETKIKSIAVIGDIANAKFAHAGNSAAIKTSYEITPLEGIQKRASAKINVVYAQGYANPTANRGRHPATSNPATAPAENLLTPALEAAKKADVVIVVAGLYRSQDEEGADRHDMALPAGQAALIEQVAAVNPRTIVVLTGGGPVEMQSWLPQTSALLQYWYGGTEGGNALAAVLFGDANPSGKLPCTFPKQLSDSPAHASGEAMSYPGQDGHENYAEGLLVGYRWFDAKHVEPQFPFGFGLSYSTFEYSDMKLSEAAIGDEHDRAAPLLTVQATITNTGTRDGAEVVQVYVQDGHAALPRPVKELKGFNKVTLRTGERKRVSIPLASGAFSYYDPAKKAWVAEAGEFTIYVGASSADLRLHATCKLPRTIVTKDGV